MWWSFHNLYIISRHTILICQLYFNKLLKKKEQTYFSNFYLEAILRTVEMGITEKGLVPLVKEVRMLGTCLIWEWEQVSSGGSGPSLEDGCSWKMVMTCIWALHTYIQNFTHSKERLLPEDWWWIQTMFQSLWKMSVVSSLNSVSPYLYMLLPSEYLIKECSCQMNTFVAHQIAP